MKPFLGEDFLLSTDAAKKLYHEFAEHMPIIDYHCHLNPKEIADDISFRNIGHLFLGGDHYKWRIMAAMGVDDKYIRGDGDDYDKFMAYAKVISMAIGNPLHHWTQLELKRVFGIDDALNERSAPAIWERANECLRTPGFTSKRLIEKFNVRVVCTTDDPADSLVNHERIAADGDFKCRVLPTFRPDKAIKVNLEGFGAYIAALSEASGIDIKRARDVLDALRARALYFNAHGCRVSDHALDTVPYAEIDMERVNKAFEAAMRGETPREECADAYRTYLLTELGAVYSELGWAQQYHMNAQRNNNRRAFIKYGADTGYDSISDELISAKLGKLLNAQEERGALPKTILYSLNPAANYILAGMAGNFQTQPGVAGKVQFGSAWWFCDQKDGMFEQMRTLAGLGMLATFVGMLTDSRSFTSYPRHEYFRRILCELVGSWVDNGEYPADWDALKAIIEGICYNNAKAYFGF